MSGVLQCFRELCLRGRPVKPSLRRAVANVAGTGGVFGVACKTCLASLRPLARDNLYFETADCDGNLEDLPCLPRGPMLSSPPYPAA